VGTYKQQIYNLKAPFNNFYYCLVVVQEFLLFQPLTLLLNQIILIKVRAHLFEEEIHFIF
jgi:hypothetical protein